MSEHNIIEVHTLGKTGSEKEEVDQLSPEESKKRLEQLVTKMDEDKDGKVTKEELVKWLIHSFG